MFLTSSVRLAYRALLIVLVIACTAAASAAHDTGNCTVHDASTRPDCAGAVGFFQKIQAAVKAGDKKQLASMVRYPLRANLQGKRLQIRSRSQFLKDYSQLFSPGVVCVIEAAKDSDVWGNYQGFMIGNGAIWWDQIIPSSEKNPNLESSNYPFKIITLNNEGATVPGCQH